MSRFDMGCRLAVATLDMRVGSVAAVFGRGLGAGFAMAALMVAGIAGGERRRGAAGEEDEGKELTHGSSPVVTLLRRLVLFTR